MSRKTYKKAKAKKDALKHIKELFEQADKIFSEEPELAHRYVKLAREIQMRNKVRMPPELKKKYCKHCNHYILTGINGKLRLRKGTMIIYCNNCKKYIKFVYKTNKINNQSIAKGR